MLVQGQFILGRANLMKNSAFLILLGVICSPLASANSHTPVDCVEAGVKKGYTENVSATLCAGAVSNAPLECVEEATKRGFLFEWAVQLCEGATSIAPVDCAEYSRSKRFHIPRTLQICSRVQQ